MPQLSSTALRLRSRATAGAALSRLRSWIERADVRAALAATIGLRLLCSLAAALFPVASPDLYPWADPFQADHFHLAHFSTPPPRPVYSLGDYLTQPWNRWDTVWYVDIARHGYTTFGATAFMPLYPALMRLTAVGGGYIAAGLLISTVAAFFAFLGLYRLAGRMAPNRDLGPTVVLVCALLPTAFFLMAAYTEALFLALSVFAILAAVEGHWWHVAVLGVCGALTRQQGVLLAVLAAPPIAVWLWQDWRVPGGGERLTGWLTRRGGLLAAATLPVLAYLAWIAALHVILRQRMPWDVLADPAAWNLRFAWPWQGLWADVSLLLQGGAPHGQPTSVAAGTALDLVMSLGALVALPLMHRRLAPGTWLYLAAIWWSSLSKVFVTGSTISASRYMLQVAPLCVVPALWLARGSGWRRLLWVGLSLVPLLLYLWAFTLYLWVA